MEARSSADALYAEVLIALESPQIALEPSYKV